MCTHECGRVNLFPLFSHEDVQWKTNLDAAWDKHIQTPRKAMYQNNGCKQQHPYVFLSCSLSLYQDWISEVLGHRLSSRSASILALLIFLKQLMEAFRAGKLIKIICRSSSFKDSPLVYVELNHAWLQNPSIGRRNWLVFLMAFQCFFISKKDSEFLWHISCRRCNNPHTKSLKTIDVCPVSSKYLVSTGRHCCVSKAAGL